MKDVLRTQKDGYMHAPTKPGLGVEIDWDIMKSKVIYSLCCETNKRIVVSKS